MTLPIVNIESFVRSTVTMTLQQARRVFIAFLLRSFHLVTNNNATGREATRQKNNNNNNNTSCLIFVLTLLTIYYHTV
jgi:hypothetical protein